MDIWRLTWDCGEAEVQALGAMMAPLRLRLGDGRRVDVLSVAPWVKSSRLAALPPILQRLRGEWPCVPFGAARALVDPAPGWEAVTEGVTEGGFLHGPTSNLEWQLQECTDDSLTVVLPFPEGGPVVRAVRRIRGVPGEAAVDLELRVDVCEPVCLPIGLHPILNLPEIVGEARIEVGRMQFGLTFPGTLEPDGIARNARGAEFSDLASVPQLDGTRADLSRLPLAEAREELVQLCGTDGSVRVVYGDDGHVVTVGWDPAVFPSCMLWISNRGRRGFPWRGRHLALGVEPVCSAFDLGSEASCRPNPISDRGIPTCYRFDPDTPFRTRYRVSAEPA